VRGGLSVCASPIMLRRMSLFLARRGSLDCCRTPNVGVANIAKAMGPISTDALESSKMTLMPSVARNEVHGRRGAASIDRLHSDEIRDRANIKRQTSRA
jgi:hypothetical protein